MGADDAGKLFLQHGAIFESLLPSDHKGETELNSLSGAVPSFETIGKIYAPNSFAYTTTNIDSFAQAINTFKSLMMFVRFGNNEWNFDVPQLRTTELNYAHSVTAIGYCIYNGKKSVIILDSWGVQNGLKGLRIVSEDWFTQNRVYVGVSFIDLPNKRFTGNLPSYEFKTDLEYGMRNKEVKKLQEVLREMGHFPDMEATGYYGGITVNAVMDFQLKEKIIDSKQEQGAGRLGPRTRFVLNSIIK